MKRWFFPLGGLLAAACSTPAPTHCAPHPAFRLTVAAADARPLPPATRVQIRYGGQSEESYQLDSPPANPQALFCRGEGVGAGAGGEGGQGGGGGGESAEVRRLQCELWTDGAAQVTVEAPGLERYDEELAATVDKDCGVTTTDAEVTLTAGASGAGGAGGGGS